MIDQKAFMLLTKQQKREYLTHILKQINDDGLFDDSIFLLETQAPIQDTTIGHIYEQILGLKADNNRIKQQDRQQNSRLLADTIQNQINQDKHDADKILLQIE